MGAPTDRFTSVWPIFWDHRDKNVKIKFSRKYGGTDRNPLHTDTYSLACTDLLMHPHRTPKTRSVWPTLWVKIARRNKVGLNTPLQATEASWALQLIHFHLRRPFGPFGPLCIMHHPTQYLHFIVVLTSTGNDIQLFFFYIPLLLIYTPLACKMLYKEKISSWMSAVCQPSYSQLFNTKLC